MSDEKKVPAFSSLPADPKKNLYQAASAVNFLVLEGFAFGVTNLATSFGYEVENKHDLTAKQQKNLDESLARALNYYTHNMASNPLAAYLITLTMINVQRFEFTKLEDAPPEIEAAPPPDHEPKKRGKAKRVEA